MTCLVTVGRRDGVLEDARFLVQFKISEIDKIDESVEPLSESGMPVDWIGG